MPYQFTCLTCKQIAAHHYPGGKYCSRQCRDVGFQRPNEITIALDGLTAAVSVSGRGQLAAYTTIDVEDVARIANIRWRLDHHGYATGHPQGRTVRLHRVLLGLMHDDGTEVDHINRDRLDNRKANLRIVSQRGNRQNRSSNRSSTSKFRGVSWDSKARRWLAQIGVGKRNIYLGLFDDEREAATVAQDARRRLHQFATD